MNTGGYWVTNLVEYAFSFLSVCFGYLQAFKNFFSDFLSQQRSAELVRRWERRYLMSQSLITPPGTYGRDLSAKLARVDAWEGSTCVTYIDHRSVV